MYDEIKKKAIMKWRETHKDEYNEYFREIVYTKHCQKIKQKRMEKYYLEKEFKRFRNILL